MGTRGSMRGRARPAGRPPWLRGLALAVLVAGAAGAIGAWWWLRVPTAGGGTPRLLVDRTDVDLGYRRFDVPVRVVFTLTNAGDGALRLAETPPVRVAAGC